MNCALLLLFALTANTLAPVLLLPCWLPLQLQLPSAPSHRRNSLLQLLTTFPMLQPSCFFSGILCVGMSNCFLVFTSFCPSSLSSMRVITVKDTVSVLNLASFTLYAGTAANACSLSVLFSALCKAPGMQSVIQAGHKGQ